MKKRILIVDDEREISLILAEFLRFEGYEVFMSGLDLLKRLKTTPGLNGFPLILISAAPVLEKNEDYLWTNFLKKPFLLDQILHLVESHLRA